MLAVIIPTCNSEKDLANLLPGIRGAAVEAGMSIRIIISDAISDDQSLTLAARSGTCIAIGHKSRGGQLRRGVALADDADWYLCLHADSRLPDNWLNIVQTHIESHEDRAGYFRLKFDSASIGARIVEWGVRLRCRAWALPYGDQGLLISRKLYEDIGGYPDWPLFEDVKIIEKLGRARLRQMPADLITCSQKYQQDGFIRRGWRNFKLLRRYKNGAAAETLALEYT